MGTTKSSTRAPSPKRRNQSERGGARSTATASRRSGTRDELRQSVAGREHEFAGVVLIAIGILLGLATYLDLAGPLGRGVETLIGWIIGVGRFGLPPLVAGCGVTLISKGRSSSPVRLLAGWSMIAAASLGILHLIREPESWSDPGDVGDGAGFLGVAVTVPLKSLIASAGTVAVLVALFVGGVLLVTSASLKTMAIHTGKGVGTVAGPIGRAAKRAISELATARASSDMATTNAESPDGSLTTRLYDGAGENEADEFSSAPVSKRRKPAVRSFEQPAMPVSGANIGEWVLPPQRHLKQAGSQTINQAEVERRGQTLQESLAQHGVETVLVGMTVGPTVTRYELELGAGVKVASVTTLQKDIAYAMAAVDVRILAPIPGRSAIGVEVPNHKRQLVALGDLMVSPEAALATHPLEVAIGKDIAGRAVFLDLSITPHLLIAGATGAGKSSALNCIITSLMMRATPDQVRLVLIDPKQVEMGQYQRLPHLLTQPVTNPKEAANALGWAVKEMERRYDILSAVGYRDITGYNKGVALNELPAPPGVAPEDTPYVHMPYIVVVVDELNDLMMVAARDVEDSITRIAQKARAVGIHLIVATQRPSVNVITGVIKANIPARMAFAVSSLIDSRVILDQPGAEKLVGKGDMLLLPGNTSVSNRIQGSFVSEEEVRAIVNHWRAQAPEPIRSGSDDDDSVVRTRSGTMHFPSPIDLTSGANQYTGGQSDDSDTVMMRQAMELIVRSQLGSTSMLQRKLKVGFARAGRIMDLLEQRGVVGPSEGSKARLVLMTVEEFELLEQNGQL